MNTLKKHLTGLLLISTSALTWANDQPQVKMSTSLGDIIIELDQEKAPETVANFLHYVDSGFYTNTLFHRVIDNFMIQGGGFSTEMQKKPTEKPIKNEADNGLKNTRGTISMARTGEPHSATAQFFINVVDNNSLNFSRKDFRGWGYAVFGKVTQGMDTVDKIRYTRTVRSGRFQNLPAKAVVINSVTRIETED